MSHEKILVVDDEARIIDLLTKRLSAHDFKVISAHSGEECLRQIQAEKPDLVILDVLMPKLSGYEVVDTIREMQGPIKNVPIIIISAKHKMKGFFQDQAVHSFIGKPFEPSELLEHVESALGLRPTVVGDAEIHLKMKTKNRAVVILGMTEFVTSKLRNYFMSMEYKVKVLDFDQDAVERISNLNPIYIFAEVLIAPDKLNVIQIHKRLQADLKLKRVPFFPFCKKKTLMDIDLKGIGDRIFDYREISDLIQDIDLYIKNLKTELSD